MLAHTVHNNIIITHIAYIICIIAHIPHITYWIKCWIAKCDMWLLCWWLSRLNIRYNIQYVIYEWLACLTYIWWNDLWVYQRATPTAVFELWYYYIYKSLCVIITLVRIDCRLVNKQPEMYTYYFITKYTNTLSIPEIIWLTVHMQLLCYFIFEKCFSCSLIK